MGGVWGGQVYEYIVKCLYCDSERCRVRWSMRSLLRAVVQGVLYFIWCIVDPYDEARRSSAVEERILSWKLLRRSF